MQISDMKRLLGLGMKEWKRINTVGETPPRMYGHSGSLITFKQNDIEHNCMLVYGGRYVKWNYWRESKEIWILDIGIINSNFKQNIL